MSLPLLVVASQRDCLHITVELEKLETKYWCVHSAFDYRKLNHSKFSGIICSSNLLSIYDLQQICLSESKPLIITEQTNSTYLKEYFALGITTIYYNNKNYQEFHCAVENWIKYNAYLSPLLVKSLAETFKIGDCKKLESLTIKRKQIARLIAEGKTYREIAEINYISIETVRDHVKKIYKTLGVHSSTELRNMITY